VDIYVKINHYKLFVTFDKIIIMTDDDVDKNELFSVMIKHCIERKNNKMTDRYVIKSSSIKTCKCIELVKKYPILQLYDLAKKCDKNNLEVIKIIKEC